MQIYFEQLWCRMSPSHKELSTEFQASGLREEGFHETASQQGRVNGGQPTMLGGP